MRALSKRTHVQEYEASSTAHISSIMKAAALLGADGGAGSPFAALEVLQRRKER